MAYAVGHTVGFVAFSGGSIRYRMYSLAGLTTSEIARLIVFISATFFLGGFALLGLALLLMPDVETAAFDIAQGVADLAGSVLLAIPILYLAATFLRRKPLSIGNWNLVLPRPAIAAAQICISIADLIFAAATLFVLLEPSLHFGFFTFLGVYLLAIGVGVLSGVPGGIGVFEAVLVAALPHVELSALLGTIILYRLIYYVAPLILALLLLVGHELQQHGAILKQSSARAADWLSAIAPQFIGAMVFLAGIVLLVSGAMPAVESRLSLISRGIPLPVLELSHMAGSAIGMALLILARGLYQRLHGAYLVALAALAAGILLSLLKGLDYEEALILAGIIILLWLSRDEFYRRESFAEQRFSPQWIVAIVLVACLALWIGLISFRHVEYSDELWWQFAFNAEAPRMLRASLVAAVVALAFGLWKVLRSGPKAALPSALPDEMEIVRKVVLEATNSSANIALLGDKHFLWSADRRAFIMYQVSGRSWIALGDPVGPASHSEDLLWAFRELVDRHNGRPVFYEVSDDCLALYIDLGLSLFKLGEEARVSLVEFSLQGGRRADLRQADNRVKKSGAEFAVVPRAAVPSIMTDLRRISDGWLASKSTAEKGFSLGAFSEEYMANFDCAVVRIDGAIVAFANLWTVAAGREMSIDLMRFEQQAPKGVMDYLFIELMLWAAANDYRWFSLGMAPLSGLEKRSLAPLWHKLGHLIFSHGEHFYNFEGLRRYKEKFDPEWRPRYLVCPGGWWNLPRALLDVSRLMSGGVTGILGK